MAQASIRYIGMARWAAQMRLWPPSSQARKASPDMPRQTERPGPVLCAIYSCVPWLPRPTASNPVLTAASADAASRVNVYVQYDQICFV